MDALKTHIISEAKKIEEESLHSAERHFAAKTPWIHLNYLIGVPTAALAATAGLAAFSKINHSEIIAGTISIAVAILTAVATLVDPNKKASVHTSAAKSYQALSNSARIMYEIEFLSATSDETIVEKLRVLAGRRDQLNADSPTTPARAYRIADQRIADNHGEAYRPRASV
jgi:hypothetical protein